MIIEKDKVGVIAYTIRIGGPEGDILEQATNELPKTMLFGNMRFLPGFENALMGLKKGDTFNFQLKALDAFGDYHQEAKIDVPREVFMENGQERADLLVEGKEIHMMDADGTPLRGIVIHIGETQVSVDFNHPLAGHELHAVGQVIDVREATDADYEQKGGCCGGHGDDGCGCSDGEEKGDCGCSDENHDCGCSDKAKEEDCPVCGNPPEQHGQGIGDCQCQ